MDDQRRFDIEVIYTWTCARRSCRSRINATVAELAEVGERDPPRCSRHAVPMVLESARTRSVQGES